MQAKLLGELRARKNDIRTRWVELLRVEPVTTPLAHPDALTHLIDWTMEEIFRGLAAGLRRRVMPTGAGCPRRTQCVCGRNPLLAYFESAAQALREALVLVQARATLLDPIERDASLEELNLVLDDVAQREIEAFCGVCQHRIKAGVEATCPKVAEPALA